ncbi:glycosyltransferase family 4 protein [Polaromonas sp.]|uniref:glycosyltransferase family 4 protein n=1 Tax=Polaromonas sp. TaxID=1869339 RepID=UPI0013BA8E4D|nr:glycosyltransferase family 4 protein [Polaromonas sp.]NDP61889.1 glycosyltransferase family 4 protein [Polaromonas sp.]
MHIAVVSNTAWYLFNFRLNLMLALQAAAHTVVAVAPDDAYAQRIRDAGIAFEAVPISGGGTHPVRELQSVLRLGAVFRRHQVSLVLSYTPKGNLYSALACIALRVPFVPNVSGLGRAFIRKSLVTRVAKTLYRLTFGRAHRVFFQNLDDMAVFVDGGLVRASQAERLPGSGVDLSRFSPTAPIARAVDAPVFLLVARMLWDKGVGEYVEAARSVRALHPGARFQLLGFLDVANPSAIPRTQVEAWVAEGVVEYLGPTDDVRPFLVLADCVVLPSYREGVPRTLLEAAATARPVITTDAPGCRDTVLDGETGFLCRPADALDLADKLLRFVALAPEERQTMGLRGRAFVEQNFDERLVIERYLAVVGDVAADRPVGRVSKA